MASRRSAPSGHIATTTTTQKWGPFSRGQKVPFLLAIPKIDLHSDTLSIRKTIGAGPLEPETYAARNADRALVESGVATHLNNNGPVTALQVLAAIRTAVNAGSERTILDSASRSSIDMINRLDQIGPRRPRPTVPGQAQARTDDNDHGYDR